MLSKNIPPGAFVIRKHPDGKFIRPRAYTRDAPFPGIASLRSQIKHFRPGQSSTFLSFFRPLASLGTMFAQRGGDVLVPTSCPPDENLILDRPSTIYAVIRHRRVRDALMAPFRESQRDSAPKPRVAPLLRASAGLPWVSVRKNDNPNGVAPHSRISNDTTTGRPGVNVPMHR
jgi:hypothetical protein